LRGEASLGCLLLFAADLQLDVGDGVRERMTSRIAKMVRRSSDKRTNPPTLGMQRDLEAMCNYAGQSAGLVRRRQPAAAIVQEKAAEACCVLAGFPRPT
jgi:hypothetical protein